jgi:hypothetical protein
MTKPAKKEFVDLINQIVGKTVMNEEKLQQVLVDAKKAFRTDGCTGFFQYIRELVDAPVSDQWMSELMKQVNTPMGMKQVSKKWNIPIHGLSRQNQK